MRKKRNLFNEKEIKILKMIAAGYSSTEIGAEFSLTVGTIDNYVKGMLIKLNAANRTNLACECIRRGIIS
ncbi:MAG: response regulator transcription factor [Clostridia bacterium]|nr:response regulator transcription factor [Clostridia bacterium]